MVKNQSSNARDTSLTPGLESSHLPWNNEAHAPQLLKPVHPRACAQQQQKTPVISLGTATKTSPHFPQLEKAHAQQQRPTTAKQK